MKLGPWDNIDLDTVRFLVSNKSEIADCSREIDQMAVCLQANHFQSYYCSKFIHRTQICYANYMKGFSKKDKNLSDMGAWFKRVDTFQRRKRRGKGKQL
mmetsp:Transcript_447/g.1683  ORF Transcript_447/g.1683 Transcript_447/m.1683 type:complete len:99 (-) Transcript_447:334-630(-)